MVYDFERERKSFSERQKWRHRSCARHFSVVFLRKKSSSSCDSHFTTPPLCSWDDSLDGIGLHCASNEDNEPSKLKHLVCWVWGSSRWGELPSCATPPKLTGGHQSGMYQPAHPCMRNLGDCCITIGNCLNIGEWQ